MAISDTWLVIPQPHRHWELYKARMYHINHLSSSRKTSMETGVRATTINANCQYQNCYFPTAELLISMIIVTNCRYALILVPVWAGFLMHQWILFGLQDGFMLGCSIAYPSFTMVYSLSLSHTAEKKEVANFGSILQKHLTLQCTWRRSSCFEHALTTRE